MNIITKILLFPIAVIYGAIITFRNWLYKSNFVGSTNFEIPVISVGNLSVGGTGKTPFIELLIETIASQYSIGVLSRGYKRKTNGYREVQHNSTALQVGDEPLMLKLKYPNVHVSVGEQRVIAIPQLLATHSAIKVILLDDAFQHQSVRPDINILLTTYDKPFFEDRILPLGTLREFASGKTRANIIVVTKCPADLSEQEQINFVNKIKPTKAQKIFFSTIEYRTPYKLLNPEERYYFDTNKQEVLLTGIANTAPLLTYLANKTKDIIHYEFADHHYFEIAELENILKNEPNIKTWFCTEKDAVRLALHKDWLIANNISLYCIPIKTKIIGNNADEFGETIKGYLDYFYGDANEKIFIENN